MRVNTYGKCPFGYLSSEPANVIGWQERHQERHGNSFSLFLLVAFVIDPTYRLSACRLWTPLEPIVRVV